MRWPFALFLAVASTVALGAHGAVGDSGTSWELFARRAVWKNVSRETRIKLFTHLPGIFPLPFVCNLFSADGLKTTVLPGDEAQAQNGDAVLWCPHHSQVNLKSGSAVRLEQEGGLPAYFANSGNLQFIFGQTTLKLEADSFTLLAAGESEKNQLLARVGSDGYSLACAGGLVDGQLKSHGNLGPQKKFLLSHNCRFGLREFGAVEKVYLFAGDITFESDLYVSRRFKPQQDFFSRLTAFNFNTQGLAMPAVLNVAPAAGVTGHLALSWSLPNTSRDLSCRLYTQSTETEAPKPGYQFKPEGTQGLITLQKEFGNLWLSMICQGPTETLVSNAVPPRRN